MMSKVKFVDANGRTIRSGAMVYFNGEFPKEMPIFEPEYYERYGVKHARKGWARYINGQLVFLTRVKGVLMQTGLSWDFDGEPCYDLVVLK
jgi:hypothetical protein